MDKPKTPTESLRIKELQKHAYNYKSLPTAELCDLIRQRTGSLRRQRNRNWLLTRLHILDRTATFRFLDLPPELRNLIYTQVLTYNCRARWVSGNGTKIRSTEMAGPVENPTALLRACRQTYAEGKWIFERCSRMVLGVEASSQNFRNRGWNRNRLKQYSWTFRQDINGVVLGTTILALYDSPKLTGLATVRNLTLHLSPLEHSPEAWLFFFTYLIQTARCLRKLELYVSPIDKNRRSCVTPLDWWHTKPEEVANALSPLKNLRSSTYLYMTGFTKECKDAVDERAGMEKCRKEEVPLRKKLMAMMCLNEMLVRHFGGEF